MSDSRMPALFIGHGNPMNAIQQNAWTQSWTAIGKMLPRPKAILCVSAHWYLPATAVTAIERPRTIHDFGGFPPELHSVQYPAPGSPALAARAAQLLEPLDVAMDRSWGLDHGTWSVLMHVYPKADIPVVQLSIDEAKAASWHFETAKKLAPLRDEGVLIVGSGNLVHNLHTYSWGNRAVEAYDWAERFEALARKTISRADFVRLVDYEALGRDAMLSVPTPDHYLPLLYVLAQHRPNDVVSFPVEGFDGGSISMLGIRLG
jgi:4,5-DOPA dioxygenase extradiol